MRASSTTPGRRLSTLPLDRDVGAVAEGDLDRARLDRDRADVLVDDLVGDRQAGGGVVDRQLAASPTTRRATCGLTMSASLTDSTMRSRISLSGTPGSAISASTATMPSTTISSISEKPPRAPSTRRSARDGLAARRMKGACGRRQSGGSSERVGGNDCRARLHCSAPQSVTARRRRPAARGRRRSLRELGRRRCAVPSYARLDGART